METEKRRISEKSWVKAGKSRSSKGEGMSVRNSGLGGKERLGKRSPGGPKNQFATATPHRLSQSLDEDSGDLRVEPMRKKHTFKFKTWCKGDRGTNKGRGWHPNSPGGGGGVGGILMRVHTKPKNKLRKLERLVLDGREEKNRLRNPTRHLRERGKHSLHSTHGQGSVIHSLS